MLSDLSAFLLSILLASENQNNFECAPNLELTPLSYPNSSGDNDQICLFQVSQSDAYNLEYQIFHCLLSKLYIPYIIEPMSII